MSLTFDVSTAFLGLNSHNLQEIWNLLIQNFLFLWEHSKYLPETQKHLSDVWPWRGRGPLGHPQYVGVSLQLTLVALTPRCLETALGAYCVLPVSNIYSKMLSMRVMGWWESGEERAPLVAWKIECEHFLKDTLIIFLCPSLPIFKQKWVALGMLQWWCLVVKYCLFQRALLLNPVMVAKRQQPNCIS